MTRSWNGKRKILLNDIHRPLDKLLHVHYFTVPFASLVISIINLLTVGSSSVISIIASVDEDFEDQAESTSTLSDKA